MRSACLVGTSVLVYAYDPTDRDKQRRAATVIAVLGGPGAGALSSQILFGPRFDPGMLVPA